MLQPMRITLALAVLALSSIARADECDDSTRECSAIGSRMWASLETGWASDAFDPFGHTFKETHAGYVNQIGQFEGNGLAPIRGNGFYLDVRLHATPHWYAGVNLQTEWADPPAATFVTRGGEMTSSWDSALLFTMAGVVGARIPMGLVAVRAELVGGLHGATLEAMTSSPSPIRADALAALLEPRVAVDASLSDRWVVEAFAGANLLDRSERVFGLGLGVQWAASDFRRH
jgi:hypothetical protein